LGLFDWMKKTKQSVVKKIEETTSEFQIDEGKLNQKQERPIEKKYLKNTEFYKKAICPYCNYQLEKAPERKKKCPQCAKFIMVKTSKISGNKILLTEEQNNELQEERDRIASYNYLIRICSAGGITEDEFIKRKGNLNQKNSGFSDFDAIWGLLNDKGIKYAKENNWGLYRNTRSAMVDLLHFEHKYDRALEVSLELMYIDLNGPNNCGTLINDYPDLAKEYPPFNPKRGDLAPAHLSWLLISIEQLGIKIEDVEKRFKEINNRLRLPIMPLAVNKAWSKLKEELVKVDEDNKRAKN
jgi:hypothetical protein